MVKPWLRHQPPPPAPPAPPPPARDPAKDGYGALVEAARADFKRELTALREEFLREVATIHANHATDAKLIETEFDALKQQVEELRSRLATLEAASGSEEWDATHPPEPYPGTPVLGDGEDTEDEEETTAPSKGVVKKSSHHPAAKKRKR